MRDVASASQTRAETCTTSLSRVLGCFRKGEACEGRLALLRSSRLPARHRALQAGVAQQTSPPSATMPPNTIC